MTVSPSLSFCISAFGFTPPSAGIIARDLSEKIEKAIIQHCESFSKGTGHCDLGRFGQDWEVKICKDSGLTINQSKVINGENYIVVNYKANSLVKSMWVLWEAQDRFFSPRLKNSNARTINRDAASSNIEVIFEAPRTRRPAPISRVAARGRCSPLHVGLPTLPHKLATALAPLRTLRSFSWR